MKKLATLTAAAALVLGFGAGQALAADRFVDAEDGDVGFDTVDGVVTLNCESTGTFAFFTIQGAISGDASNSLIPADPGDRIRVCPGTYVGNVDVNVIDLELIGLKGGDEFACAGDQATVQPCVFAVLVDEEGSAITITAAGVTVRGFKVTGSGKGAGDAGIRVESSNNIVRKNTALFNENHGILIASGTNNMVVDNNVHDNGRSGSVFGDGILVDSAGNFVIDNKAHDNFDDGFEFASATNGTTTVNGNRSRKNGGCGFNGDAIYGTGRNRNRADNNDVNFCADPPESGATGSIKGKVTDDVTEETLENVDVTAGTDGFFTTSGNGRYRIRNIPAGDLFLTATVGGCTQKFGPVVVEILADDTITEDIVMLCPSP